MKKIVSASIDPNSHQLFLSTLPAKIQPFIRIATDNHNQGCIEVVRRIMKGKYNPITPELIKQLAKYASEEGLTLKLDNSDLSKLKLRGSKFAGASFIKADCTGVDFNGSDFTRSNFTNADCTDAHFFHTTWTDATLEGANFTRAFLPGTRITGGNLSDTNFTDAYIANTKFTDVNLTNANFTNANLADTNFTNVNLTGANFTNANLIGAKGAQLSEDQWRSVNKQQCLSAGPLTSC